MDGQFFPGQGVQFEGPPPLIDPYWGSTELLLHFGGADASTTFTDSSPNALTVTPVGNAQIDTAQSVFGGSSYLGDGTGDYLSIASTALLAPGTGDFTLEFRVRFSSSIAARDVRPFTGPASGLEIVMYNGELNIGQRNVGNIVSLASWSSAIDTWYAIAAVRSGTDAYLFVDGSVVASAAGSSHNLATGIVNIMGRSDNTARSVPGWMDELRFTKGVARYTSAYPVRPSPFPNRGKL